MSDILPTPAKRVYWTGTYRGTEQRFKGRRALLILEDCLVRAQFNDGANWETHSWITFDKDDWTLDEMV